jgi:hypothetical protein
MALHHYDYDGLLEDGWNKARTAYANTYYRYFPKEVILTTDTVDGQVARVCINAEAEHTMQNQRKLMYMIGAPVIILGGYILRRKKADRLLGNALVAMGAYCAWSSYKAHGKVERLLSAAVVSPAATVPVTVEAASQAVAQTIVAKAEEVAEKAAMVDAAVEAAAAAPVTIAAEDAAELGYYGAGKFGHGLNILPPYRDGGGMDRPWAGVLPGWGQMSISPGLRRKKPKKGTYAYRRARANLLNA